MSQIIRNSELHYNNDEDVDISLLIMIKSVLSPDQNAFTGLHKQK